MKCGVAVAFMNVGDIERVTAEDWSRPPAVPDHEIWEQSLALGDLIEPLGFDSLWSSEHHSTPYGLCPNTLMHLAYWAGRTERIELGTHVVVLPWHHPVQVAHEIAMLDIMMSGRSFRLGVGRGLSPREFGALGVPQDEARQRFKESIDILKLGLSNPRFSYDGQIFKVPETSIRPEPRHRDIFDGAVGAFMTPPSLEVVARSGMGQIVVAGQSYEQVGRDTALFNHFRGEEGYEPTMQPIVYLWAYCTERASDAERAVAPLTQMGSAGAYHYGFLDASKSPANIKGYEHYGDYLAQQAKQPVDPYGPHLIGTPDQIISRVAEMQEKTGARELITLFNFAGCLPADEAERSMRLFAKEVLPAVHEIQTPLREFDLELPVSVG